MLRTKMMWSLLAFPLLLLLPSRGSASPILSVSPASTTASVGDTVTIAVNIAGVIDLYDYQLDLNFDPTVLQASSVSEGTFLAGAGTTFFLPGAIDNVGGSISFNADTLLSAILGESGSGTLALLDFTALAAGVTDLTISNEILQDSTGAILTDTVANGTVTALGTGGSGPPSPVPEIPSLFLVSTGLVVSASFGARRAS